MTVIQKPQNLKQMLAILREHKKTLNDKFGVLNIAIFGSFVKNDQHDDSDVDLFVELKHEFKTFDNFMELKFFLEEHLQKRVDLAVKETIRKEFKSEIFNEAVYV